MARVGIEEQLSVMADLSVGQERAGAIKATFRHDVTRSSGGGTECEQRLTAIGPAAAGGRYRPRAEVSPAP
jgi:hypothetical protein